MSQFRNATCRPDTTEALGKKPTVDLIEQKIWRFYYWLVLIGVMQGCGPDSRKNVDFDQFGKYWFQGKAEISSFDLTQYRYGEPREGEAVLIFVTEDFSAKKQVKLDNPQDAGKDAVTVLKLNKTKNFLTGIYPYHMMLSVFTPVFLAESALKLTASAQEWCGQTYTQFNKAGHHYTGRTFSYFEVDGDRSFNLKAVPEDDLWNLIRIDPNQIPLGKVALIPSLMNQRFTHRPFDVAEAEVSLQDAGENFQELQVAYLHGGRILKVRFYSFFPHEIIGWEEIRVLDDSTREVTTAERKSMIRSDYWNKNSLGDEILRKELKLRQ